MGRDRVGLQATGDLEPVHLRQLHVHEDEIGAVPAGELEGLGSGFGLDHAIGAGSQGVSCQLTVQLVVLDHQDGALSARHRDRLDCRLPGTDDNLQGYLDPIFDLESCRASLAELGRRADLTQYSTPIAADDLNEVRQALGYDEINVSGGSYGTRASLIYIRRHPETVRTAILNGVAPLVFTNPLYHATFAQRALDLLFEEVENDPKYREAYPKLREEFAEIMERLERKPAEVTVAHPTTRELVPVKLTRAAFAEALRVLMYSMQTARQVPLLIQRAHRGDYRPFAERGMMSNRGLRRMLAFGMLLSVTAAEDVARIDPESIPELTEHTFLGDGRVRQQMAVCAFWPRSRLSEDFGEPVCSDVPTLILSGTIDPVTPPEMGDEVHRHFPNSVHLVVPAAHGVGGGRIQQITKNFLEAGSVEGLDTSGLEDLRLPPLQLPDPTKARRAH